MPSNSKSVIFDLDGTLVDSQKSILDCITAALELNDVIPDIEITKDIVGPPLLETFHKITKSTNSELNKKLIETFISQYDAEGYKKTQPFPGINAELVNLKANGFRLFVATNKRIVPTIKIIDHLNWRCFFDGVYSIDSSSDGRYESKGKMIADLVNNHNIFKKSAIYVGDRIEDYEAASENDLETVLVSWGYGFEMNENQSFTIVDFVDDLTNRIKEIV